MKAEYLPFNDKHSIQEAQISILFLGSFERQAIEVSRGITLAELSDALPRATEVRGGSFNIEINESQARLQSGAMPSELVGFELSRLKANGQRARVLRLEDNILSVSLMDYVRWQSTREYASRCLSTVLTSLPLHQNPVVAIRLRFIDRYTFSGDPRRAEADLLFNRESPHITLHSFRAGDKWHCNTGWFDTSLFEDNGRVLHNLNVTSSLVDLSSTVTVDHHATRYLGWACHSVEALLETSNRAIGMIDALDKLHDQNKKVLKELLRPEILAKIGISL